MRKGPSSWRRGRLSERETKLDQQTIVVEGREAKYDEQEEEIKRSAVVLKGREERCSTREENAAEATRNFTDQ